MSFFSKIWRTIYRSKSAEPQAQEVGFRAGTRVSEYQSPWSRLRDRKRLWEDLNTMDSEEGIVARGLDHIAGLVTTSDDDSVLGFDLEGPSNELDILEPLCQASNLRGNSFDIVRSMVLYGDHFLELVANENMVIAELKQFPYSYQIQVNWDDKGNLCQGDPNKAMMGLSGPTIEPPAYTQTDDIGRLIAAFYPYQIAQFSFGVKRGLRYAEPLLGCVTGAWKRLRAMEDGLAVARLTRAYTQRVHHIPIVAPGSGNPPDAVQKSIKAYREQMTEDTLVPYDTTNARFSAVQRTVPPAVDTDIYVPRYYNPNDMAKTVDADVTNLRADDPHLTNIEDVYLCLRRLICALSVPPRYLNLDVGQKAFVDRSTEEAREAFAYVVMRVGRAYKNSLRQVFDLQLLLNGVNPFKAKYEIVLPKSIPPSATRTAAQVETLRSQTAIIWNKLGIPTEIIGKHVLRLSNNELDQWIAAGGAQSISPADVQAWLAMGGGRDLTQEDLEQWQADAMAQLSGGERGVVLP